VITVEQFKSDNEVITHGSSSTNTYSQCCYGYSFLGILSYF